MYKTNTQVHEKYIDRLPLEYEARTTVVQLKSKA